MKDLVRRTCLLTLLTLFLLVLSDGLVLGAGAVGPFIVRYSPPAGEVSIGIKPVSIPIEVYFDEAMNSGTITTSTFFVKNDAGSTQTATVTYDSTSKKAVLVLAASANFATNNKYFITVKGGASGVKNSSNVAMTTDFNWTFTTGTSDYNISHQNYTSSTTKCGLCHQVHRGQEQGLLRKSSTADMCFICHDGTASKYNIQTIFTTGTVVSFHPVKGIAISGQTNPGTMKCNNCHNPHNANSSRPSAPDASGSLAYAKGVGVPSRTAWTAIASNAYTYKYNPTYQYELCYKCHSTYNDPNKSTKRDVSLEFNPANKGFHSMEANSPNTKGIFVNGFTSTTRVFCTDCHGSPTSGTAIGPHASIYTKILKGKWTIDTGKNTNNDDATTHLCFRCHSKDAYGETSQASSTYRESTLTGFYNSDRGNLHWYHANKTTYGCQFCHSAVVHGFNGNKHLIVTTSSSAPYKSSVAKLSMYIDPGSGNYSNPLNVCGSPSCSDGRH